SPAWSLRVARSGKDEKSASSAIVVAPITIPASLDCPLRRSAAIIALLWVTPSAPQERPWGTFDRPAQPTAVGRWCKRLHPGEDAICTFCGAGSGPAGGDRSVLRGTLKESRASPCRRTPPGVLHFDFTRRPGGTGRPSMASRASRAP